MGKISASPERLVQLRQLLADALALGEEDKSAELLADISREFPNEPQNENVGPTRKSESDDE